MHLEKMKLRNFRSFDDECIILSRDITIFVGENNGGKSNSIDAIRLITSPLGGRREIYCEHTDIRFDSTTHRFDLEARYVELGVPQQGRLLTAAEGVGLDTAVFGLTYDESTGKFPVRPNSWAGQHRAPAESGCHEMIRHVYLPPLRDAKRALASGNPTRIHALLKHFLGDEDPKALAKRLQRNAEEPILGKVDGAVDVGLKELTSGVRRQGASLGFAADEKLIDIARDLRFKLADHGIVPEDIRYSGHGYANLLYMATIAVELEKVNAADLTLFLVEEPEAHLHPQLQAAVLCFLEEQAEKSRKPKPDYDGPAGELQVVVATHSPNLSAWVESKNLVFFKSTFAAVPVAEPAAPEAAPPVAQAPAAVGAAPVPAAVPAAPAAEPQKRRLTKTIPLASLNLTPIERRKIDRYLDVTKSAFLFGGRVLLVEGIAEALLLPVIAKKIVLKDHAEKYRLFRSAVFVPIDSVDFEPYVKLLLTPHNGIHVADSVVVVTDGDKMTVAAGEPLPGYARKTKLMKIVTDLNTATALDISVNTYSLETELVVAGNGALMKGVYLELHPNSEAKWDAAAAKAGDDLATDMQEIFKTTRKGDFAQILAEKINSGEAFVVPPYIKTAIEALVK